MPTAQGPPDAKESFGTWDVKSDFAGKPSTSRRPNHPLESFRPHSIRQRGPEMTYPATPSFCRISFSTILAACNDAAPQPPEPGNLVLSPVLRGEEKRCRKPLNREPPRKERRPLRARPAPVAVSNIPAPTSRHGAARDMMGAHRIPASLPRKSV